MTAEITEHQWNAVRESLRRTTERFAALVSSIPDCDVKATAKWSVAEIAAHVTIIAWVDTTLLQPGADPFPMPGLTEEIAATIVDDVHGLNDVMLGLFAERDPDRILAMLRDHVTRMLDACADRDPAQTVPWLGGSKLSLAGLAAHLVNELLIHGDDIARAVKAPWEMPPQDAAHFFEIFFVGLIRGQLGRVLDGSVRPRARRIAVEFRSRYTTPVTLVVRSGRVSAEPPGSGADATVTFDPATLNKMLFGRVSKPRAVLTRKLVIGGPRPWLLAAFLRTVRAPS
jgi:uncharacterized protein (TIGR03083 family)